MIVSYSLTPLRILTVAGFALTLLGVYSVCDMMIGSISPVITDPADLEELTSVSMFFSILQEINEGNRWRFLQHYMVSDCYDFKHRIVLSHRCSISVMI